jgi:hypothetical protein
MRSCFFIFVKRKLSADPLIWITKKPEKYFMKSQNPTNAINAINATNASNAILPWIDKLFEKVYINTHEEV